MNEPLTPEREAGLVDAIRQRAGTPDGSYRALAAEFDVSKRVVELTAKRHGLGDAWAAGRPQTENATAQRRANLAAKRAEIEDGLLDDIVELRAKLWDDVTVHGVGTDRDPDGGQQARMITKELPAGPSAWRETMSAIGTASKASTDLARLAAEQAGSGQASGLLDQFERSLADARRARDAARQADTGTVDGMGE